MERANVYKNKTTIYSFLNTQNFDKAKRPLDLCKSLPIENEVTKMQAAVAKLRSKIIINKEDINDVLSELEFFLASGSNDKKLSQIFYSTKFFLELIECMNIAKNWHMHKLLTFFEKILRGNKYIAKYLSKNSHLVRKILCQMQNPPLFDICIKISEELFMNSQDLIQISNFYKEIEENYILVENTKLDSFCRILAIMIFDHKKIEFKQIFKYKEHLKVKPAPKITTENQSVCFHLPRFLINLFNTFKNKLEYTINIVNSSSLMTSSLLLNEISTNNNAVNIIVNHFNNNIFDSDELPIMKNEQSVYNFDNINSLPIYSNEIFNYTNKIYESLRKSELIYLVQSNVFSNFVPDWTDLKQKTIKVIIYLTFTQK